MKAVKTEIDEVTLARGQLYKVPEKLRKRDDGLLTPDQNRTVEANEYVACSLQVCFGSFDINCLCAVVPATRLDIETSYLV